MSMWDILYAFGVGVSFVVGIAFGSANNNEGRTRRMTTKEGHDEWREEIRQQHETLVDLLEKKNVILEEILVTIQSLEINK